MGLFGVILLAMSLSMDSMGIGISYGLRKVRISLIVKIIISLISIIFTAASIFIGELILLIIDKDIAKLMGCLMLIVLGAFIIYQALKKNQKDKKSIRPMTRSFMLKSFGITIKIIRDPISCDFDRSSHIDIKEAIYLGVALSIDSFGAGISSAVSGLDSYFIPLAVGLCQFLFLSGGIILGKKISTLKKVDSKVFVVASGVLLIVLAFIRYFI